MKSDDLRRIFLQFFADKGHKVIPSSSLVPYGDHTLLLTTAGMVQIKPYFLGVEVPPSPRLTSCQKCFRTTDIDIVGDDKHLTFFEMLGNFSVGDYFKKEAISWSWEFVTQYLKLPQDRLWVTIYLDDDEAFDYWRQVGVPVERILRFGDEDNFWGPAGDSGPCGPCSEIHYDSGEEFGCGRPDCRPNCECGRFSEIWNLVFSQYNQHSDGHRSLLPKPNIDTGMGMERTLAAIQGVNSFYDTDIFIPLIQRICRLSHKSYGEEKNVDRAIRVVAEHGRAVTFLIADGVMPSNEGRGYVLRRILRRASFFGRQLELYKPFLMEIAEVTIEHMGHVYPELVAARGRVIDVIRAEEQKFGVTLEAGLDVLMKLVADASNQGKGQLSGEEVFYLHDTHGFPPELTQEIASEHGLSIDWTEYQAEMEKQRERARASQATSASSILELGRLVSFGLKAVNPTHFVGYSEFTTKSQLLGMIRGGEPCDSASEGDEVNMVLDRTPFYGEMGGQVGDTGEISGAGGKMSVTNTLRGPSDVIVHQGKVLEGRFSVGDEVSLEVDISRRMDIARNHTATHLLQAALRQILGRDVAQRGSVVDPDRLRFDFSYSAVVGQDQLLHIQRWVNERIRWDLEINTKVLPYQDAIADGAIALFEEKYGETVREVIVGKPPISKELCGGTHVGSTGQIGLFLITGEASIGTGVCRIEAITGRTAEAFIEQQISHLQQVTGVLGCLPQEVESKIQVLLDELGEERKRSLWLERMLSRKLADSLLQKASRENNVTFIAGKLPSLTMPVLRETGDILRDKLQSAIVVLGTIYDDKPMFVAMVTPDLVSRGFNAGSIIREVAKIAGGSGGGRADMAQAGGRDVSKIDDALELVGKIIARG